LNEIADYGSLQKVLTESPLAAATAFLETVILSATIEIIMLLPLTQGSATGKFMVNLFTGVVVAIASLLLLNYVIKGSAAYQWGCIRNRKHHSFGIGWNYPNAYRLAV
jgi:hypothetical protein